MENIWSDFSDEKKLIFSHFISFHDYFSVDWFPEFPISKILSVLILLEQRHWISPNQNLEGYYTWSANFPRQEIIGEIPSEEMSTIYRNSISILVRELPENDEKPLLICRQCLMAGLQEEDLDIVLKAALIEEKRHRISFAIEFYESILDFFESITQQETSLSEQTWHIFIKAVIRRTSFSFFHPSLKKANQYLLKALNIAKNLRDIRSQASLELLIGQHYWMYLQYNQAAQHFDNGWKIITQIEDEELYKQGLKVKGLTYVIKGQYLKAIEAYEQSLGEIESDDDSDFSFFAALNLALCYAEVGMPQRGFGICERIQKHGKKNANWPLLAFSLVGTGILLLEIKQFKTSRSYFSEALALARRENIPMAEVLAGIGLSNIECHAGNFDAAAEHFNVIWRIRKSSRYYAIIFYPLMDTVYMLHSKGLVQPIEFTPAVEFMNQLKKEEVSALTYAEIRRLQIGLPENQEPIPEKIKKLLELEKKATQMGATLELAKISIDLAGLFNQNGERQKAKKYTRQAYDFFEPFAENCIPSDLQPLIPRNKIKINKNERLFHLAIEMGDALNNHENLERLLTKIITSISRLTGAERAALFIKDGNASEIKMIASRNFLEEEIKEASFEKSLSAIHDTMVSQDGKILQNVTGSQDSSDFRQIIITPLRSGRRVTGVLYQDSRFFSLKTSPDDIKLLSALASQIGVSIDRAQAYDEIARLNKKLIQENLYYLEEKEEFRPFGEIIGSSATVRNLHHLIQRVAPTTSTVLIYGETGVGKELVARAIHRESLRGKYPFIRVNCAALPDTLIDSELFGHEKGAFTGAIKTREGRFELANLGTIFLDEVSELPLPTQSRLLRILQEKEFQRVGGTKILHSDFRLITATNKDLQEEVAKGNFREDLFYRLNVFPINVPPLRERKEDIPLLAVHFFKLYCSQSNRPYAGITEAEMEHLKNYSWPGNIRELSNMIERHIIMGSSKISLPELKDKGKTIKGTKETLHQDGNIKLINIVQDDERKHILEALEKTRGKVSGKDGAAALLGMHRSALTRRMKKLQFKLERHLKYTD
ncbi:MAG: sigma 54-interacting transcriptional regulator [Smithellaceae bacterium]